VDISPSAQVNDVTVETFFLLAELMVASSLEMAWEMKLSD